MYPLERFGFISTAFVFGIFGLASIMLLTVFAEPKLEVSPTCGPAEPGFNIVINANGFKPNSTVAVKFVTSDSKIPLYTQFDTNSTGGFNDVTFADDLKEVIINYIWVMMLMATEHSTLELSEFMQT